MMNLLIDVGASWLTNPAENKIKQTGKDTQAKYLATGFSKSRSLGKKFINHRKPNMNVNLLLVEPHSSIHAH